MYIVPFPGSKQICNSCVTNIKIVHAKQSVSFGCAKKTVCLKDNHKENTKIIILINSKTMIAIYFINCQILTTETLYVSNFVATNLK